MIEASARNETMRSRRPWLRTFVVGLALWLVSVITTFATGNRT
jgi:hypothetical protein